MARSYAATRLRLSPLTRCRCCCLRCERVAGLFSRAASSPPFMLHAQAGQWRRNPAGRTRDGSRGPPFPSGASLPVRGAGCVPPFRAGSVTGACPSLSSLCTFPVFSPACPSAALAVISLCNQRLGLLTQRFSTGLLPKNVDIHASGARDRLLPMSRHFS